MISGDAGGDQRLFLYARGPIPTCTLSTLHGAATSSDRMNMTTRDPNKENL